MDKREFIKLALAVAGGSLGPYVRNAVAYATPAVSDNGRLIMVFMRGALDGLFAISPVDDPQLQSLRPSLATAVLANGIRLGQTGFAAHPSCEQLSGLFAAGELSFAPCAGTTDKSRSHFQAQDLFELGTGAIRGDTGFMARAAEVLGGSGKAISFTQEIPLSFQGMAKPPEVAPLSGSGLKLPPGRLRDAILSTHHGSRTGDALEQAIATESEIESSMGMEVAAARGAPGVNGFPSTAGHMGRMLKDNPMLSLAFMDLGGFDTHVAEENILTNSLKNFSAGLVALKASLGPEEWRRTRVVVMSEFGRTARENGTHGTDHGHGGIALLAGGNIPGARMFGGFHGLADNVLNDGRDLPVLVDWRDFVADSMRAVYGLSNRNLDHIFPARPGKFTS